MPLFARFHVTMVDVRDVALLHVRAMTHPGAAGKRYAATSREAVPFVRIAEVLAANGYPKLSTRTAPDALIRVMGLFDPEIRGRVAAGGRRGVVGRRPARYPAHAPSSLRRLFQVRDQVGLREACVFDPLPGRVWQALGASAAQRGRQVGDGLVERNVCLTRV